MAHWIPGFSMGIGDTAVRLVVPVALLLGIAGCLALPQFHSIAAPIGGDVLDANLPAFSPGHLLGSDADGNDVLSRLVYGGRTSLLIALTVNLLGLSCGGVLGIVAAYKGSFLDALVMRTLDAFIAFPPLIIVLTVAQGLGTGTRNTIAALAFFSVPAFARVARASTLRVQQQTFILAAQLSGAGTLRILTRHIVPSILPQLASYALLGMGVVVTIEGAISFLGLGAPLPQPSWGNMIYQGQLSLAATPRLVLLPSLFLFVTALSFNLLSETLRERWSAR